MVIEFFEVVFNVVLLMYRVCEGFQRIGEISCVMCIFSCCRWCMLWWFFGVNLSDLVKFVLSIVFILLVKFLLMVIIIILKFSWNEWLFRLVLLMVVVLWFISIIFWWRKLGWQWNILILVWIVFSVQRLDVVYIVWWFGCEGISRCMLMLCSIVRCRVVIIVLLGMKYGEVIQICLWVVLIILMKNSEQVFWVFVGLLVIIWQSVFLLLYCGGRISGGRLWVVQYQFLVKFFCRYVIVGLCSFMWVLCQGVSGGFLLRYLMLMLCLLMKLYLLFIIMILWWLWKFIWKWLSMLLLVLKLCICMLFWCSCLIQWCGSVWLLMVLQRKNILMLLVVCFSSSCWRCWLRVLLWMMKNCIRIIWWVVEIVLNIVLKLVLLLISRCIWLFVRVGVWVICISVLSFLQLLIWWVVRVFLIQGCQFSLVVVRCILWLVWCCVSMQVLKWL